MICLTCYFWNFVLLLLKYLKKRFSIGVWYCTYYVFISVKCWWFEEKIGWTWEHYCEYLNKNRPKLPNLGIIPKTNKYSMRFFFSIFFYWIGYCCSLNLSPVIESCTHNERKKEERRNSCSCSNKPIFILPSFVFIAKYNTWLNLNYDEVHIGWHSCCCKLPLV